MRSNFINLIIFLVFFAFIGLVVGQKIVVQKKVEQTQETQALGITYKAPLPTPLSTSTENIPLPKKLLIPSLGVDSAVEVVGEDNQGKMDVPKGVMNVGWYKFGPKPGQRGSAVLAGHLDDVNGNPAVFYNLKKLKVGDEMVVLDEQKKEFKFKISQIKTYPYDAFPLKEVFGDSDKPRLNLITCGGVFNTRARNYSERVVAYSELVND